MVLRHDNDGCRGPKQTAPVLHGGYACADEAAMRSLGAALAIELQAASEQASHGALLVTLSGDLGAGKTFLARAVLHALGHEGPVRSPTYTLIESYACDGLMVAHLDLYRLSSADELETLAYRDVLAIHDVLLVEWPERACGELGQVRCEVTIEALDGALDNGRRVQVKWSPSHVPQAR